jgi:2-C-methyl-D-erythritol 4-phosphate cytidylyltransferase
MKKYSFILLSGGVGTRMMSIKPKQFIEINGVPIIQYSLQAIKNIQNIKEVIINYPIGEKSNVKSIVKSSGISCKVIYVKAGSTRQESVYKMIKKANYKNIIIHEAARPIVNESTFTNLIDSNFKNCGYMSKIPFTVVPVDNETSTVIGNLQRDSLRNVLLPQKFVLKDLLKAHIKASKNNEKYTEDSTLFIRNTDEKFYFIDADDRNIKITHPHDLRIVENILLSKNHE